MASDADLSDIKVDFKERKNIRRSGVSDLDDLDDVFDDCDPKVNVNHETEKSDMALRPITYKTGVDEGTKSGNASKIKTKKLENKSKSGANETKRKNSLDDLEYSLQPIGIKNRERKHEEISKEHRSETGNGKIRVLDKRDSGGIPNDLRKQNQNTDLLTLKPIGNAKVNKTQNGKPTEHHVSKIDIGPEKNVTNPKHEEVKRREEINKEQHDKTMDNKELLETIDVKIPKIKSKNHPIESRPLEKYTAQTHKEYAQDKTSHLKGLKQNRNVDSGREHKATPEQEKMFVEQQNVARKQRQKERTGKRSVSFSQEKSTELNTEEKDPNQLTMSKKFRNFARQMSEQSSVTSSFQRKRRKRPNTCFDLALFACCCCCSPLGGIGMLLSVMSDNAFKQSQYSKATVLRKATIGVSVGGIILTMLLVIIVLATQFTILQT